MWLSTKALGSITSAAKEGKREPVLRKQKSGSRAHFSSPHLGPAGTPKASPENLPVNPPVPYRLPGCLSASSHRAAPKVLRLTPQFLCSCSAWTVSFPGLSLFLYSRQDGP